MDDQGQFYLAIHTGHSRIKIGIFNTLKNSNFPNTVQTLISNNESPFPWESLIKIQEGNSPFISVISGSNSEKADEIEHHWRTNFPTALRIKDNSNIPVINKTDYPSKVGPDRLLNAVAVNVLKDQNSPCIIIDTGTAVTVDALDQEGRFLGGAILPGVLMGARAMHRFTTTLPLIQGGQFLDHPPTAIGKNTEDAMGSGLFWGHLGAIRELYERMNAELGNKTQLFLTGGAMKILKPYFPYAVCESNLCLLGSVLTAQNILPQNS